MRLLTLDKLPASVLAKIDLQTAHRVSALVLAAERTKLFRKLEGRALSSASIRRRTGIHPNFLEHFLNALVSIGLLKKRGGLYRNSALADRYFVKERSIHWTEHYSGECIAELETLGVIERMLATGKGFREILGKKEQDYLTRMRREPERAKRFTQMLYDYHQPDARALADNLDLGGRRSVLDVGGGSGVMSMALARRYPTLTACVLDIAPVCRVAAKIIRDEDLSDRVKVQPGDMNEDLPEGYEVILFCDVGRLEDRPLKLARERLPRNGLLVLVDLYFAENRTEPLERLLRQFVSTAFPDETWRQMVERVRAAGFTRVRARRILDGLWMITGLKAS
jgi:predicted nicotinamide N-methyase